MSGMEGTCSRCRAHYYGWALENSLNHRCGKCGSALEIRRDGMLLPAETFDMKAAATAELLAPRFTLSDNVDLIQN